MPLDEQGDKWACEPCIRGHRSTKCEHWERFMMRVRKPGRPLTACPHGGSRCTCTDERVMMVKIVKDSVCVCRPVEVVDGRSRKHSPARARVSNTQGTRPGWQYREEEMIRQSKIPRTRPGSIADQRAFFSGITDGYHSSSSSFPNSLAWAPDGSTSYDATGYMQHTSHGQMHNKLAYQHSADSRQRDPHTGVHSNNNASHHHAYTQAGPNGSFASFETPQYAQKHEGIVSGVSEGLQGPQFMQFGPPLPSGSYYTGNGTQFANPPAFTLEGTLFPPASSAMDNDPPKSFAAHSMANGFVFSPSPFSADLGPIQSPESSFLNYSHLRAFESNLKKSDLLNPSAQNLQYPNPMLTYESSSLDSSPPLSAELGSAENVLAHSSAHELIGQDLALLMDLSDQEVTVDFSSVHQLPTSYGPATHSISPTQLAEPQQSHCVCATNTAPGYLLPESTELAPSPAERNASASPAQSCSCGPGCECLLCATHPYNHTSIQHIQQLEHIMDEDDARNCSEHHLMGSGRNSPSPFEIHDLVSSTAQMTTEHLPSPVKGMHEDRRNPQDSDVSDMSRTRNASDYYHFEYHLKTVEDPVLVGMPCGNSGCVCGEDCACEGCPTHGNASIYPFARVITSESMVGDAAVDHSIEIGVRDHKDPLDATDDFTSAFWLAAEQQDASQDSLSYR